MASGGVLGRPLAEKIRFATEATQVDTYKHRDLLPLPKAAGMRMLWFGIEDLTATLVNKGQKAVVTAELFRIMRDLKIAPMAMLMFHAAQPFHSPAGCVLLRLHQQLSPAPERAWSALAVPAASDREPRPVRRHRRCAAFRREAPPMVPSVSAAPDPAFPHLRRS